MVVDQYDSLLLPLEFTNLTILFIQNKGSVYKLW
jgi:hypothetical protein